MTALIKDHAPSVTPRRSFWESFWRAVASLVALGPPAIMCATALRRTAGGSRRAAEVLEKRRPPRPMVGVVALHRDTATCSLIIDQIYLRSFAASPEINAARTRALSTVNRSCWKGEAS